jgi:hypothetical protein
MGDEYEISELDCSVKDVVDSEIKSPAKLEYVVTPSLEGDEGT